MFFDLKAESGADDVGGEPQALAVDIERASPQVLAGVRGWFARYTAVVARTGTSRILAEHCLQVSEEMPRLGHDLGLEPGLADLAGLLGLLHDIGRLEKDPGYDFFTHRGGGRGEGEQAIAILEREGVLHALSPPRQDVIRRALLLHHENSRTSRSEPATVALLTNLLHDADRLDNWRIALREYRQVNGYRNPVVRHGLTDSPGCSLRVRNRVTSGRPADPRDVRNLNDLRLLQLGWVFEVHFPATLARIRTRRTIDDLRRTLHGCDNLDALFAPAQALVKTTDCG